MAAKNPSYLNKVFEEEEIWTEYDTGDSILGKAKYLYSRIPGDVRSILDVGCGNGVITNFLAQKFPMVTGVDISESALLKVDCHTIKSSSASIPVDQDSYDLVFSSQLLEHLPEEVLKSTLQEFKRISRKYILVTIPLRENLRARYARCSACGREYHVYHHVQSFPVRRITRLFEPEFKSVETFTDNAKTRRDLKLLIFLKQKFLGQYFHTKRPVVCYYCGHQRTTSPKQNIFTKMLNAANRVLAPRSSFWVGGLFEKKTQ